MCGAILVRLVDGIGQTAFEFGAIKQASQRVVACLVGQVQRMSAFTLHIAEHYRNSREQQQRRHDSDARYQEIAQLPRDLA